MWWQRHGSPTARQQSTKKHLQKVMYPIKIINLTADVIPGFMPTS